MNVRVWTQKCAPWGRRWVKDTGLVLPPPEPCLYTQHFLSVSMDLTCEKYSVENFFQLHFTGRLFDHLMPEHYSARRKMDNLGKEPAAAKRLSTLPAAIRQPLALTKNTVRPGATSPFLCTRAIFYSDCPDVPVCSWTSEQTATQNK